MSPALPRAVRPPLPLAAAKAVTRIPGPDRLPGGALYEPIWDGYRVMLAVDEGDTGIWSRQGKDLTRYFPKLIAAAVEHIPTGCIVDGEAVIWRDGRLDFEALQQRMTSSKAALPESFNWRATPSPASVRSFDIRV